METISRRGYIVGGLSSLVNGTLRGEEGRRAQIRRITRGSLFHWFGYYDNLQFDPQDRFALAMEVAFEHRSPRPEDRVVLGMIDLHEGDRWVPLAESTAWCWQQGCMFQWRPGSATETVFNDREGGRYVARILDVQSGKVKTVDFPIYAISPDGRTAVSTDFRRLAWARPGYGYNGIADPFADVSAPQESGIWRVDLETGQGELIISLAQVAAIPWRYGVLEGCVHWFNHLLINSTGTRFVFLHRWREPRATSWRTRLLSANLDGSDLRVVIDSGFVSHFIWRDAEHILAYSKRQPEENWAFYLWQDRPEGTVIQVGAGVMGPGDGHCNYFPGGEWIVCDTYPDAKRFQQLYLYHVPSGRRVDLASFLSPKEYSGEWRCDLHPRVSRSGRYITVDSAHEGGRQVYLVDISAIVSTAS